MQNELITLCENKNLETSALHLVAEKINDLENYVKKCNDEIKTLNLVIKNKNYNYLTKFFEDKKKALEDKLDYVEYGEYYFPINVDFTDLQMLFDYVGVKIERHVNSGYLKYRFYW